MVLNNKTIKVGAVIALCGFAFHILGKGEKITVKERVETTGEGSSMKGLGNLLLVIGTGALAYGFIKQIK